MIKIKLSAISLLEYSFSVGGKITQTGDFKKGNFEIFNLNYDIWCLKGLKFDKLSKK